MSLDCCYRLKKKTAKLNPQPKLRGKLFPSPIQKRRKKTTPLFGNSARLVNFLSFHAFAVSEDWRGPGTQVKPEAGGPMKGIEMAIPKTL